MHTLSPPLEDVQLSLRPRLQTAMPTSKGSLEFNGTLTPTVCGENSEEFSGGRGGRTVPDVPCDGE